MTHTARRRDAKRAPLQKFIDGVQLPNAEKLAQTIIWIPGRVLLAERDAIGKVAEAISKETGVSVRVLNPLEGLSYEELKAGADYFSVMEDNLEQLKAAWE